MVYSMTITWGIGAGVITYTLGTSLQRMKIRNDVKMIEDEFLSFSLKQIFKRVLFKFNLCKDSFELL